VTLLTAGPLTVRLAGAELRHARVAGREVLRRIAVVVRDDAWGTVEPALERVQVEPRPAGGFRVRAAARCARGPVDVSWEAEFGGDADGCLDCSVRLEPHARFAYNRMGLVLLHPIAGHAGNGFRGEGDAGVTQGRLPALVGPQRAGADGVLQALFPPVTALSLALGDDLEVRFAFEGDQFEMEDQRNWIDGSFKTYSTPLALGTPHRAQPGRALAQRVRLDVRGGGGAAARDDGPAATLAEIGRGAGSGRVPALGVALGAHAADAPPPARGLAHLRVDLAPGEDWSARLDAAARLGLPLEVAVTVDGPDRLAGLAEALRGRDTARVLLHAADAVCTPDWLAREAGEALGGLGVARYGGTDAHLAELNRERPALPGLEGICFSASPQAHLTDDDTLRESLEGLRDAVRTVVELAGDRRVAVTPITLRPRHGPGSEAGPDPRRSTPFAAAWTFGAIAGLALGGAWSATLHEVTGPAGVVGPDGAPYPVLEVLDLLAPLAGEAVTAASVPDPLALAGLWLDATGELLLANLADTPQAVRVPELGAQATLAPGALERLG